MTTKKIYAVFWLIYVTLLNSMKYRFGTQFD